jgi:hypothetical protein
VGDGVTAATADGDVGVALTVGEEFRIAVVVGEAAGDGAKSAEP